MAKYERLANYTARDIIDLFNITKPPVKLQQICDILDIDFRLSDFWDDNLSGKVYIEGENPVIEVNNQHSFERKRFTLAHELGHLFRHIATGLKSEVNDPKFRRAGDFDYTEIQANKFAAGLLMPKSFIEDEIEKFEDDVDINSLARKFEVSYDAMYWRLKNLGYDIN